MLASSLWLALQAVLSQSCLEAASDDAITRAIEAFTAIGPEELRLRRAALKADVDGILPDLRHAL